MFCVVRACVSRACGSAYWNSVVSWIDAQFYYLMLTVLGDTNCSSFVSRPGGKSRSARIGCLTSGTGPSGLLEPGGAGAF
jgi:hypothetical protein